MSSSNTIALPECWGHRGASAAFPENTLASFEAAIKDGADGIESDVHVTLDDVVVMFHDPELSRTTDAKAVIRTSNWHGDDGIHKARTLKAPHQAIPTFEQTIQLLMKPENLHVKFNVDVKMQNDPDRLFRLMHQVISSFDNWEKDLAPRILLGLWHPKFINPAKNNLPYLRRSHIGPTLEVIKNWFWDDCVNFSLSFACLATAEGEAFRNECKKAGKSIMVWTVNTPDEMLQAALWGVDVIITDLPRVWLDLRAKLRDDYTNTVTVKKDPYFLWKSWKYYWVSQMVLSRLHRMYLQKTGGPLEFAPSVSVGIIA